MTITFENDDDVIIYGLEKIIAYARRTQQIFVAQCVWWLASILRLEQGLIVCIDNLRKASSEASAEISGSGVSLTPRDIREDLRKRTELSPALSKDLRINSNQQEKRFSPTSRDLQEDPRSYIGTDNIHPDRIQQVRNESPDLEEEYDSVPDQLSRVLKEAGQFLSLSRKDRKAFNKKKAKDQLSRTRSGKILARPLNDKQRKYLQSIPKDTIVEYVANRK